MQYIVCNLTGNFGGTQTKGNWSGILKLMHEKVIDFIPHIFSINDERMELMSIDFPMPKDYGVVILGAKKKRNMNDPFKIFKAFSLKIWLLILISFLLYSIINFFTKKFQKNQTNSSITLNLYRFINSLVDVFALFMGKTSEDWSCLNRTQQKQSHHFRSIRILRYSLIIWSISSFILCQLLSVDMVALLLSDQDETIDRFDQLTTHNYIHYHLLTVNHSSSECEFRNKYPYLVHRARSIPYEEMGSIETIRSIIDRNYVLILSGHNAKMLVTAYNHMDLYISKEVHSSLLGTYVIRKDLTSKLKRRLIYIVKMIYYFGINLNIDHKTIYFNVVRKKIRDFRQLDNVEIDRTKELEKIRKTRQSIRVQSRLGSLIQKIFYFYFIGISITFLTFTFELIHFYSKRLLSTEKRIHQLPRQMPSSTTEDDLVGGGGGDDVGDGDEDHDDIDSDDDEIKTIDFVRTKNRNLERI
ncbi:hypothetical protein SSS_07083 [Sarcoptes scabiei]|uniref:Uncharacterized protein n=1 Tax=Sarcoptes scabiei TaxID=52283 RepID=A0A834VH83_SARSC|nr:hypothetical protein SSS_07083 [Sarcoptes scabiei]